MRWRKEAEGEEEEEEKENIVSILPVTACSSAGRSPFCLNSKSPSARDNARLPSSKKRRKMKET